MHISNLKATEYNSYYHNYVKTLGEVSLLPELKNRKDAMLELLHGIPAFHFDFSYTDGKWTVKQLILHIIDTERVFQHRAFTFAREKGAKLNGFEQDLYVDNSEASKRTKENLLAEFISVRESSVNLFQFLPDEVYENSGNVEGNIMTVKAAGFIICGHQKHHEIIVKERYLPLMGV